MSSKRKKKIEYECMKCETNLGTVEGVTIDIRKFEAGGIAIQQTILMFCSECADEQFNFEGSIL